MKKLLCILLMLPALAMATDREHDRKIPPIQYDKWNGSDKPLHFGVSAILGFSARTFYPNEPWKAVGIAMIPGVLKEATDPKFSGKDLAVDLAGAMLGVYVGGCYVTHKQAVCGWRF
jgi:hypothetical protein